MKFFPKTKIPMIPLIPVGTFAYPSRLNSNVTYTWNLPLLLNSYKFGESSCLGPDLGPNEWSRTEQIRQKFLARLRLRNCMTRAIHCTIFPPMYHLTRDKMTGIWRNGLLKLISIFIFLVLSPTSGILFFSLLKKRRDSFCPEGSSS